MIPAGIFPLEQYTREVDPIHARGIIFEYSEADSEKFSCTTKKMALISLEIPSVRVEGTMERLKKAVAQTADVSEKNIWICTTHNLTTMHIPPRDMKDKHEEFMKALENAVISVCKKAIREMKNVRIGVGFTTCDVNTNRDIKTNQGWWNGLQGEGEEDKLLTVYRIEDEAGIPVAVLYHYPIKSCTVTGSFYPDHTRVSTSEITGESSRLIEEKTKAVAIFLMGAAADMVPAKCAVYSIADANGDLKDIDLGIKKGLEYKNELGAILGNEVCTCLEKIICKEDVFLYWTRKQFWYRGQQFYNGGRPYHPTPDYKYVPAEDEELVVDVLCIGDTVIFGLAPETTAVIGRKLRERTNPVIALVAAMVNGGKDYMADELSYERCTFSGTHSVFSRGTAEQFIEDAAKLVRKIYTEKRE